MLEIFALLLIPFAFVVAFGYLVKDKRQARLLLAVMAGILVVLASIAMFAEQNGNPRSRRSASTSRSRSTQSGGNMEGKEVRFGAAVLRCVRGGDDRHVDRRGQLHARLVHAARRRRADDAA